MVKNEKSAIPSNDQVCRLCDNGVRKHPLPYSFVEPVCQNGYNKIIKPFGVVGRDNRFYPCPVEIKASDTTWLQNFIINGITPAERNIYMIGYAQKKNGIGLFEKRLDPLCGTFKPGTTHIDSMVFVKKDSLENREKDEEKDEEDEEKDEEDEYSDYIKVKIIDKKKSHGKGNDEMVVSYTVECEDTTRYTTIGKYFHPMHVENRDFIGFTELAKIKNSKIGTNANVKQLLLECFEKWNLIGYQETHVYSNSLKLVYNEPEQLRKDQYRLIIPHTMNMLTHSVIVITKTELTINGILRAHNTIDDDFKPVKLQCLGYLKNTFYILDVIDGGRDKHRIDEAKKYLELYDLINVYASIGINIIFKLNEDAALSTKVYVDHSSTGQRYIIPGGVCSRLIVLPVVEVEGCYISLGLDDEPMFRTFLNGVSVGDYVRVKVNLLPSGFLRDDCTVLDPKKVNEDKYLGYEKTSELLEFILKKSIVE